MKSSQRLTFFFLLLTGNCLLAQETETRENFGHTLNAGTGAGYYPYIGYFVCSSHLDYELEIDNNLTVAPFVSYYQYEGTHVWGDVDSPYRKYHYAETVIPIGLKVSYYFDELLKAGRNWDFYSSASLGFNFRKTSWEEAYFGRSEINPGMGPLYLDFHIGSELHVTKTFGIQLDVSAFRATLGLSIHL